MRPVQPFKYNLVWAVWEHLMILSKILSQNVESNHCLGFYCNNPNLNKVRELIKNMCFLKYFFSFQCTVGTLPISQNVEKLVVLCKFPQNPKSNLQRH